MEFRSSLYLIRFQLRDRIFDMIAWFDQPINDGRFVNTLA